MTRTARLASTLLVTAAAVVLSGCTASAPTPTMDSTAATERYQPVMTELVAALEQAYPDVVWSDDDETRVVTDGDGCTLVVSTQRGEPSLWKSAGDWDAVSDVIDPVLEDKGLDAATEQKLDGGWTGVASRDDNGAELHISDKTYTLIELSVPVTDSNC